MFNVGGGELFVILLLALIVLGPDKLPGAMRTVGQWVGEARKMASGFQDQMNAALDDHVDAKSTEKPRPASNGNGSKPADDAPSAPAE
jgi:sec-independent protein translocase protein TatB